MKGGVKAFEGSVLFGSIGFTRGQKWDLGFALNARPYTYKHEKTIPKLLNDFKNGNTTQVDYFLRKLIEKSSDFSSLVDNSREGNLSTGAFFILKGGIKGAVVERDPLGTSRITNLKSEKDENKIFNLGYDGQFYFVQTNQDRNDP